MNIYIYIYIYIYINNKVEPLQWTLMSDLSHVTLLSDPLK